jgi:hypothetical protein
MLVRLALLFAFCATAFAQTPGQNTNMVSGTTFPGGDPFLQRQNEPSVAVSTRNPQHILAGANDYRTVDLPASDTLPGPAVTGDAWLGVFKSFDGGQTWRSTLLPGYPQDTSAAGMASPLKGFQTAADAVVRAGSNGMFYYSGIAFNRGTNQGVVFVSRFMDLNNKENGNVVQGTDSIKYLSAFVVDRGSAGQFLDKPWVAVDIPRGTATCSIQVPQDGRTVAQTIPAGNIYLAYTVLVGNDVNIRTKLYLSRSLDCGATWSQPTKLSEGLPVNQGASVAVDPKNGYVYVAWRGFATVNQPNSINIVRSTDYGATFTKATTIKSLPTYSDSTPTAESFFDQGTTAGSFRTNAFPAMAVDANGRVYVAWAQRGLAGSDSRIAITSSADFVNWTTPVMADNETLHDDYAASFSSGHQFMPTLTFTDGRLMLLYYDERFDHTVGLFTPNNPFLPEVGTGKFYQEKRDLRGELKNGIPFQTPFVTDSGLTEMRHTIEVRVAQAVPAANAPLNFTTARVSQYKFGVPSDDTGVNTELEQLQINPPNLPLFQQGTVPFIGDYIDIAGLSMVKPAGAPWKFNTDVTPAPQHIATYTSNQDVRPPLDGDWTHYTPLGPAGPSLYNGTPKPQCVNGQEGMRNQNIYSSVITQGLRVAAQQNVKLLSTTVPRQFVLTVENQTNFDKHFRITIGAQPAGGTASLLPIPNPIPSPLPAPLTFLDVDVAAHSGVSRGVYALSTSPTATIPVTVNETGVPNGTQGLTASVLLNADPTVAALANPDGSTGVGISSAEIYNPNVSNPNVSNPNVSNPNVSNPNVSNPNVSNPNVSNPNVSNPNVSNPNVSNLDVANPNVSNPNVSNPNVSNPNVSNPNVSNQNLSADDPVTDATYTVTNSGNTTASYTVQLVGDTSETSPLQLIITRPYTNPTAIDCTMMQQSNNVLLSNVNSPKILSSVLLTNSQITTGNIDNPTISIPPGESIFVTLRGYVPKDEMEQIITQVTPVIVSQAPNTNDPTNTPSFAAVFPDLVVDSFTHSPATPSTTDLITFTAVVKNAGTAEAAPSLLQLRVGGEGEPPVYQVPKLAPGQSVTITRQLVLDVAQAYLSSATADVGGAVAELNENNNSATQAFSVLQSNLAFVSQLSTATVGQPIKPAVQVRALDNAGAPVSGYTVNIALGNTGTGPGGGALFGTLSAVTNGQGIATFSDLVIDKPGSGYTLVASGQGTASTSSPSFIEVNPSFINFEFLPNGSTPCGNCQATTQFETFGVTFSYNPNNVNQPTLFDSSAYDPANDQNNHSVASGFVTGTMSMSLNTPTTYLRFQIRGNNDITTFPVAVFDAQGNQLTFNRTVVKTYTNSAGFLFREEIIEISSQAPIARVDFDSNGFLEIIDNLSFTPPIL